MIRIRKLDLYPRNGCMLEGWISSSALDAYLESTMLFMLLPISAQPQKLYPWQGICWLRMDNRFRVSRHGSKIIRFPMRMALRKIYITTCSYKLDWMNRFSKTSLKGVVNCFSPVMRWLMIRQRFQHTPRNRMRPGMDLTKLMTD